MKLPFLNYRTVLLAVSGSNTKIGYVTPMRHARPFPPSGAGAVCLHPLSSLTIRIR